MYVAVIFPPSLLSVWEQTSTKILYPFLWGEGGKRVTFGVCDKWQLSSSPVQTLCVFSSSSQRSCLLSSVLLVDLHLMSSLVLYMYAFPHI